MITPDNEIAKNNEDNDNPRNSSNEQENAQTIESDLSADTDDELTSSDVADIAAIDVADRAAEAAYTLDVDKGIDDGPTERNDEYNIKK